MEDTLGVRLLTQATFGLEHKQPQFSARRVMTRAQARWALGSLVPVLMLVAMRPGVGSVLLTAAVAIGYIANAVFRAWLFWVGSDLEAASAEQRSDRDGDLPTYTILIPLYREANLIPQIAEALAALDYPSDRIDAKLVLEADDLETIAAVEAAALPWECLHVPASEPRTKPKACNYALQFARGEFLVIYDAEDRPEPDQLKKAVAAFRNGPPDVACLQARLNFFNAKETRFLTRGMLAHGDKTQAKRGIKQNSWIQQVPEGALDECADEGVGRASLRHCLWNKPRGLRPWCSRNCTTVLYAFPRRRPRSRYAQRRQLHS